MEVKKGKKITRNNINQYLCFNWNYEKERGRREGWYGPKIGSNKGAKGCIQQYY